MAATASITVNVTRVKAVLAPVMRQIIIDPVLMPHTPAARSEVLSPPPPLTFPVGSNCSRLHRNLIEAGERKYIDQFLELLRRFLSVNSIPQLLAIGGGG
jgi:hypothetical protein